MEKRQPLQLRVVESLGICIEKKRTSNPTTHHIIKLIQNGLQSTISVFVNNGKGVHSQSRTSGDFFPPLSNILRYSRSYLGLLDFLNLDPNLSY